LCTFVSLPPFSDIPFPFLFYLSVLVSLLFLHFPLLYTNTAYVNISQNVTLQENSNKKYPGPHPLRAQGNKQPQTVIYDYRYSSFHTLLYKLLNHKVVT
jgi:hypothetical protein